MTHLIKPEHVLKIAFKLGITSQLNNISKNIVETDLLWIPYLYLLIDIPDCNQLNNAIDNELVELIDIKINQKIDELC